jgi:hypothetical protein
MFDPSKASLQEWLNKFPSFLPDGAYRAQFLGAKEHTNADDQDLILMDLLVNVGSKAPPRKLRKIYRSDDPILFPELLKAAYIHESEVACESTLVEALNCTPNLFFDIATHLYCGDDFFIPYSLIASVHPAGELYTDYSNE